MRIRLSFGCEAAKARAYICKILIFCNVHILYLWAESKSDIFLFQFCGRGSVLWKCHFLSIKDVSDDKLLTWKPLHKASM